jgi:diguanylate cyclase (GGDEF)-like protein
LPEGTYIVAVRSLYVTLVPSLTMALAFIGVGTLVVIESPDRLLITLIALGVVAIVARLGVLVLGRISASDPTLDAVRARELERLFAIPYLAFAAAFGAFSVRAFQVATAESHMLVVGLLFGYAAGVAAGTFLRPWIAIPSMILAVGPTSIVALTTPDSTYVAAGALLFLFLGAGVQSLLHTYRIATTEITTRRTFATLARSDALTGLENRLSLREAFERALARGGRGKILAVHCLDLDRFKAVNDTYGHPVGDALLRAVSDRLRSVLREGDVAARIGGDEFVILQVGVGHIGEAHLQAHRVARAIAEPYSVMGHMLSIGTSIGYALHPQDGRDLDDLVSCADEALIRAKRHGGGVSMYEPKAADHTRRLSA